jgi:hypothetical protein
MNDLRRVDPQDPTFKPGLPHARTGKKVAVCLLATLIGSAMIAWVGFLGWGIVEVLQWLSACIKTFWTTYV